MSIVNGIIQAPVTITDVKTALGETSNDLATLCRSDKINMWAKYKPVELNKTFTSDEFDFENRKWRDNATWYRGADFEGVGICGIKIAHSSTLQSLTELYDKGQSNWSRVKVGSTFVCPYRLSDFIGYKHAATAPFKRPFVTSKTNENGSVFATMMIKNLDTENELTMQELGKLSEAYLGLALKDAAGRLVYFMTTDKPLKNGGVNFEMQGIAFAPGDYKAYLFLCSAVLTLNKPPMQATYYTIPDFKPSVVNITSEAQHINDYFTIKAYEDIRGHIIVDVEIRDNYVRRSNNENFYIILRFASSETGSPIKIGEQAFTFTDVEAGTKYTHMFDKRASEERYKIEYTFMSVTQETYIKELNLFTNQ
nr:MAG TPA: hypothetical protein [Caudoviricetes sp.]